MFRDTLPNGPDAVVRFMVCINERMIGITESMHRFMVFRLNIITGLGDAYTGTHTG